VGEAKGQAASTQGGTAAPTSASATGAKPVAKRKLSYKEQRELDELPSRIEALEAEQKRLSEQLAGTALYAESPQRVAEVHARHGQIDEELMALLERWEALSAPAR
jgi:ABC transport system ATP-binding/permease protein